MPRNGEIQDSHMAGGLNGIACPVQRTERFMFSTLVIVPQTDLATTAIEFTAQEHEGQNPTALGKLPYMTLTH